MQWVRDALPSFPSCVAVALPQCELLTFLPDYRLHSPDLGFPGNSDSKLSTCNAGDPGSIPGWGRPPGEGNGEWHGEGNPLSGLQIHTWPYDHAWESLEDCLQGVDLTVRHLSVHLFVLLQAGKVHKKVGAITR